MDSRHQESIKAIQESLKAMEERHREEMREMRSEYREGNRALHEKLDHPTESRFAVTQS